MRKLSGKVAVVTGGASGIGRAMALGFAAEGMNVVIADVEDEPADRVRQEIGRLGVKALALHTDVADRAAVERLAEMTFSKMGGAHLICNNAGVGTAGPLDRMSDDDWRWVLSVNLEGVIHGVQAFVPRLRDQGQGGHVVNTSSMAGMVATPGLGIYQTTKFAVVGLSESLRLDLEPYDIGVSVLCPAFVRTALGQAERNRPEELSDSGGSQETMQEVRGLIDAGIDASIVAERVIRAVKNNELYIFTHPELKPLVQARFDQIMAAIDAVG